MGELLRGVGSCVGEFARDGAERGATLGPSLDIYSGSEGEGRCCHIGIKINTGSLRRATQGGAQILQQALSDTKAYTRVITNRYEIDTNREAVA